MKISAVPVSLKKKNHLIINNNLVIQSCPTLCDLMNYIAHHAPLSMEFFRQEYWGGFPFPIPGALPDPGIKPRSPTLQTDALPSEPPGKSLLVSSLYLDGKN